MNKECENCGSSSMEMCLIFKKCPHWAEKPNDNNKKENK